MSYQEWAKHAEEMPGDPGVARKGRWGGSRWSFFCLQYYFVVVLVVFFVWFGTYMYLYELCYDVVSFFMFVVLLCFFGFALVSLVVTCGSVASTLLFDPGKHTLFGLEARVLRRYILGRLVLSFLVGERKVQELPK